MFDDFLVRAIAAIILLALGAGPLGSVAIWRRMGFFSDAMAHAALLGISISLLAGISPMIGLLAVALLVGIGLGTVRSETTSADGLLAVMAHGGLAAALVVVSLSAQGRSNLDSYLFGDILAVTKDELAIMAVVTVGLLAVLVWRWQKILVTILSPEMATAHGVNTTLEARIFTIILALFVAVGINIVGALMIGAFLIIPAMTARRFVGSPEAMAFLAIGIGIASGLLGLWASWVFDVPTAPMMVVVATLLFILSVIFRRNVVT